MQTVTEGSVSMIWPTSSGESAQFRKADKASYKTLLLTGEVR